MFTNGRPPLPPVELGRTGSALLSDLTELAELQAKLLAADSRSAANRSAGSMALVGVGVVLAASGLPLLLVAAAYGLVAAGLPRWAGFLIAAFLGVALGGGIALLGWKGLKRAAGTFRRSGAAFSHNVAWAKASLTGKPPADAAAAVPASSPVDPLRSPPRSAAPR